MANDDQYLRLRRLTGETAPDSAYTDADLQEFINEAQQSLEIAAGMIWREKAATYADMVNHSEAGSSRSESDLYDRAIAQAGYWEGQTGTGSAADTGGSTTRRIVRA
jgi:hypothetical protein